MRKTKVVVFTDNGARILINPPDIHQFEIMSNVAINPDLSAVAGLPPHQWALSGGIVVPAKAEEVAAREARLSAPRESVSFIIPDSVHIYKMLAIIFGISFCISVLYAVFAK